MIPITMNRRLTCFLDAGDAAALVRGVGVRQAIEQIAGCVRDDFLRWPDFEKSARLASHRRRGPSRRGGNPSKQNRSQGSPETASAVSTADGPGTEVTVTPFSTAAATSR